MADCNTKYTSILSIWQGIDAYLVEADKILCSKSCPCIADKTLFASYSAYTTIINGWTIDLNVKTGATDFSKCSDVAKSAAYDSAIKIDPRLDVDQSFNAAGFSKAFAFMEKTFECSGWCTKSYTVTSGTTTTTVPIFKYLYYGVNK